MGLDKGRFRLNSNGQAALMDSIFFLTIVSAICTALFFFTINYGVSLEEQINSFYSSDFAVDSLKVITYINVPRTGESLTVSSTSEGFDYLLSMMKEDFADEGEMSSSTKRAIVRTLSATMKPFDDSIDYSFYLTKDGDDFLFIVLAMHERDSSDPTIVERTFYYCTEKDSSFVIDDIYPYVGRISSARGKTSLIPPAMPPETDPLANNPVNYSIGLDVWVATTIPDLNLSTDADCKEIVLS